MKKVAITGGLSCGKSTVCQFLEEHGAYVLSSDEIVHQLLSPETNLGQKIIGLLGQDIVTKNHQIDRKKIAEKVFNRREWLIELEHLVHPPVKEEIGRRFNEIKDDAHYALFVVEVPLLYESSFEPFFDAVVAVVADEQIAKRRFMTSGEKEKAFQLRMDRQLASNEKMNRADFVITNNTTLEELRNSVAKLFQQLEIL